MANSFENLIDPLDKQFRVVLNKKTNTQQTIPAIDKIFMESRDFLTYLPPPIHILNEVNDRNQALADEYIERLKYIEVDLKWLLSLDYQHFWSQVIYDKSLKSLMDSYLKYAPRSHDLFKLDNLPKKIIDLHDSIHKLIFLVCLRMSTYKESKENFLTPEAFATIVYNNYLFDIPKIIDICVLFKKNDILPKMIGNLFKTQEKYYDDFKACLKDINKAFDTSKNQLVKIFDLDAIYNVNSKKESLPDRIKSNLMTIIETIYYMTDFAISLNNFITVQSEIGEILNQNQFQDNIKDLFENTLIVIENKLSKLSKDDKALKESIKLVNSKLKALKFQLTKLFKKIFESCSITPILRHADENGTHQESKLQHYVDIFLQMCSQMFEYEQFLSYYEEKFKLSEQIDIVVQLSGNQIEESQHKYFIDSLKTCVMNHSKKRSVKMRFYDNEVAKRIENDSVTSKEIKQVKPSTSASIEVKSQSDLAVKSILDLFPDQNVTLIKKCLKYFNNNIEEVINSFLENNIPEFPAEQTETFENKKSGYLDYDNDYVDYEGLNIKKDKELSGLNQRRNIYDGDDFDIFKKDSIDKSKIVIGKKNTTDTFDLDNKEDINREFYKNYDHLMYNRALSEENPEEYEDEYDDTYDENTNTAELETESFIKPLNQKLGIKKRDEFEVDDEDEENDEDNDTEKKPLSTLTSNQPRNHQQGQFKQKESNTKSSQNRNDNRYQSEKQQQQQQQLREQPKQQRDFQRSHQQKYNQREDNRNHQRNQQADQQQSQNQKENNNQQFKSTNRNNDWKDERSNQQQQQHSQQQHQQNKPLPQRNNKRNQASNYDYEDENEPQQQQNVSAQSSVKTEEEIKRERRWKNENKSKTVHHNRKDLAAKKNNFY